MPTKKTENTSRADPKNSGPAPSSSDIDTSKWKSQSRVTKGSTINKGKVVELYRLKDKDIQEIAFEESEREMSSGGKTFNATMKLYDEKAIEWQAWLKHGGPENFVKYLEKLRTKWIASGKTKPFPAPAGYRSAFNGGSGEVWMLSASDVLPILETRWICTRTLRELEQALPSWLWVSYNTSLDCATDYATNGMEGVRVNLKDREKAMQAARIVASKYPQRPHDPFPSSPSIEHLRDLLERAPKLINGLGEVTNVTQDYLIHEEFDGASGYNTFSWSTGYLDDLFQALMDVLDAHGWPGWKHIRWEVYDKYTECLRDGPHYWRISENWSDCGFAWLCGHLNPSSIYGWTNPYRYSEIGRQYNARLPVLDITSYIPDMHFMGDE